MTKHRHYYYVLVVRTDRGRWEARRFHSDFDARQLAGDEAPLFIAAMLQQFGLRPADLGDAPCVKIEVFDDPAGCKAAYDQLTVGMVRHTAH